jgi:hypothetical protein
MPRVKAKNKSRPGTRKKQPVKFTMVVNDPNVTIVLESLSGLQKQDREVLVRRYGKKETTKDLAKSLGLAPNDAAIRIHKATDLLQKEVVRRTQKIAALKKFSSHSTSSWTEEKDDRRCELIDREISGEITQQEQNELNELQEQMLAYRRSVAPLPLHPAQLLHRQLLKDLSGT